MSDPRLEARLADLGAHVAFPPAPDVAARVRARVAVERPARRLRPALALPLALLAVALGGVAVSPDARSAVLRWLGIEGVRIERVPETPRPPASPALDLGARTTLADAPAAAGFRPAVPRDAALGPPDGVFAEPGLVTLLYRPGPGLPESGQTGAGAVLSEFPGRTRPEFVQKQAGPGTRVERVRVDGEPGFWLSGTLHALAYEDPGGGFHESPQRLAGSTLVWRRGPLTLRLEADVTKERALTIARSIRSEGSTP